MSAEQFGLPEHFPTVKMDIGYGKMVDELDIDMAAVSDFLVGRGFSDEAIDETTVHFSTEKQRKIGGTNTLATYDPTTKTINLGTALFEQPKIANSPRPKIPRLKNTLQNRGPVEYEDPKRMMNMALRHELEHRVSDNESGMEAHLQHRKNHIGKMAVVSAAWFYGSFQTNKFVDKVTDEFSESSKNALAGAAVIAAGIGYQMLMNKLEESTYRTNPEETRAYDAEAADPRNFITLTERV